MHKTYIDQFNAGDFLAASRLMSIVERGGEAAESVLTALFPKMGNAYRVGITGATGSGKSSLINGLTAAYRKNDVVLGVVAEDPTSPFTGGAILGDRIRMHAAIGDPGVFIRSVASRGTDTGFSALAHELADVLDAFGRELILLETTGVGQLEHRIRFSADTTVVVFTPEGGDDVQSLKSGLMEIGDVFCVNKADRPHADRFAADLDSTLDLRYKGKDWVPLVVQTTAHKEKGIDDLIDAVARHRTHMESQGRLQEKRKQGLKSRLRYIAEEKLAAEFWRNPYIQSRFDAILKEVTAGDRSPYEAASALVDAFDQNDHQGGSE